ncbi:MAG: type II toxin-antitoxin system Phd/YefM family antitoxin [Caulobacteraceae bacterium]
MHDAKTNLSKLVDQASKGEPFVIAKAGKPLVKVTSLNDPGPSEIKRIGFLEGEIETPVDFDHMGAAEIAGMFGLSE